MGDNNPYRPYTHEWGNREREIRDRRNNERAWDDWGKSFGPKDSGGGGGGDGLKFSWGSGEPIDAEEVILFAFCCGFLPLVAYVAAGRISVLPWWAYLGAASALGWVALNFPKFAQLFGNTSKIAFAFLIIASCSQIVELHNRILLLAITTLSLLFAVLVSTIPRLNYVAKIARNFNVLAMGTFGILIVVIFVSFILVRVFGVDANWVGGWSTWLLQLLAGSFFRLFETIMRLLDPYFASDMLRRPMPAGVSLSG